MTYVKPAITVYTQEEIDALIAASACGSVAGSCYNGCNAKDCTFNTCSNYSTGNTGNNGNNP